MNEKTKESYEIPDADQIPVFWSNAEWLKTLKGENNYQNQERLVITKEMVSNQSRKITNWKVPGKDGVQGFLIEKLLHLWTSVLCQRDRTRGNAVDNYRSISCLPLMWKLEEEKILP